MSRLTPPVVLATCVVLVSLLSLSTEAAPPPLVNVIDSEREATPAGLLRQYSPTAPPSGKRRPIIFMHGIFGVGNEIEFAQNYIPKRVPGVDMYYIDMFKGVRSATSLDVQLEFILPALQKVMDAHRDTGVTLLCYSQGGVICRSAVEMLSTHNVHTMITLSSPLDGQYGVTSYVDEIVPFKDRRYLWAFWYSTFGQDFSVGNYWNDPHHQKQFSDPKTDVLTARLNNQTGHSNSTEYKKNFMKLQRLIMVGGPNDSVITPWQSAHLGFYDEGETVIPFEKQPWYATDDFGLKTLNEAGKVKTYTIPGVHHIYWYRTQKVYDCCVIPYLT